MEDSLENERNLRESLDNLANFEKYFFFQKLADSNSIQMILNECQKLFKKSLVSKKEDHGYKSLSGQITKQRLNSENFSLFLKSFKNKTKATSDFLLNERTEISEILKKFGPSKSQITSKPKNNFSISNKLCTVWNNLPTLNEYKDLNSLFYFRKNQFLAEIEIFSNKYLLILQEIDENNYISELSSISLQGKIINIQFSPSKCFFGIKYSEGSRIFQVKNNQIILLNKMMYFWMKSFTFVDSPGGERLVFIDKKGIFSVFSLRKLEMVYSKKESGVSSVHYLTEKSVFVVTNGLEFGVFSLVENKFSNFVKLPHNSSVNNRIYRNNFNQTKEESKIFVSKNYFCLNFRNWKF